MLELDPYIHNRLRELQAFEARKARERQELVAEFSPPRHWPDPRRLVAPRLMALGELLERIGRSMLPPDDALRSIARE
jgi:hypothetical protein